MKDELGGEIIKESIGSKAKHIDIWKKRRLNIKRHKKVCDKKKT